MIILIEELNSIRASHGPEDLQWNDHHPSADMNPHHIDRFLLVYVFVYEEILDQWRIITKEKQAAIVVLDMPLLDTRSNRDLTGTLIADIVLQLLSYVAQTEREFIHQRQMEGIAAAKRNGVRFGPPPKERGVEYERCLEEWRCGVLSARMAGEKLGVAHTTFLKWARSECKI